MDFRLHLLKMGLYLTIAIIGMGLAGNQSAAYGQPARRVTAKDLPRIPPTEPEDALATFELAKDFRLELVAAEPLVADPSTPVSTNSGGCLSPKCTVTRSRRSQRN